MSKHTPYPLFIVLVLISALFACQKEGGGDPFDGSGVNQDTVRLDIIDPEPASIAGIYQNVFRATCANVGCHDGTFEPDFRTLESSYNTLVYQEPIKNDGNYTYRVAPGDPSHSTLLARLEDRLSPAMPIQLEPDSDWPEKGAEYIQHIREWIEAGAPDITGTVRQKNHPAPILVGAGAEVGQQWQTRLGGTGPILMPDTADQAILYFAFRHDEMDPRQFTDNQIAFSLSPNVFDSTAVRMPLEVIQNPVRQRGFYGEEVDYTHRVVLDPLDMLDTGQAQWYFRVYVKDEKNPITEIPTDNGIFYIKSYMSFQWTK